MQKVEYHIVSISKAKKKGSCFVNFKNGEWLLINTDLVVRFNLKIGTNLDFENINKIKYEQNLIEAKQKAYNYSTFKPRTERQVREKLKELKYTNDLIDICINFLYEYEYLNDLKFAIAYAKEMKEIKSYNSEKIKQKLLSKGISKSFIDIALKGLFNNEEIENQINKFIDKKLKLLANKPKDKVKLSLLSSLQRQGFEWDKIKKVISDREIF